MSHYLLVLRDHITEPPVSQSPKTVVFHLLSSLEVKRRIVPWSEPEVHLCVVSASQMSPGSERRNKFDTAFTYHFLSSPVKQSGSLKLS